MKTLTVHRWMRRHWLQCAGVWGVTVVAVVSAGAVHAQVDPFIGQLMPIANSFCPMGSVEANGQIMPIRANTALFSLLGTTYGGNGSTTFAVPDLQGRAAVHEGQGPGLSSMGLGETMGQDQILLSTSNMPAHTHSLTFSASTSAATHSAPASGRQLAQSQNAGIYADAGGAATTLAAGNTGVAGSMVPLDIRNPSVAIIWCIAYQGVYPSRP